MNQELDLFQVDNRGKLKYNFLWINTEPLALPSDQITLILAYQNVVKLLQLTYRH